jgi:hypothetical protein
MVHYQQTLILTILQGRLCHTPTQPTPPEANADADAEVEIDLSLDLNLYIDVDAALYVHSTGGYDVEVAFNDNDAAGDDGSSDDNDADPLHPFHP